MPTPGGEQGGAQDGELNGLELRHYATRTWKHSQDSHQFRSHSSHGMTQEGKPDPDGSAGQNMAFEACVHSSFN